MAAKRLVIDASVAGAAGGTDAEHPTARRCRDFLVTMLNETEHRLVMSPAIEREWNDHQSGFTRGWRRSMSASRRIVWPPVAASAPLRRGVDACPVIESERSAMLKDLILIEAALASDKTVVSRDDTVRRLFRANLARLRALRPVVWVNPERPDEAAVDWLRSGAKPERRRQLGWVQEAGG